MSAKPRSRRARKSARTVTHKALRKRPRRRKYSRGIDNRGIFGYPSNPAPILRRTPSEKSLIKRARDSLSISSEAHDDRLQMIAETIPQIVWTADPDGYQDFFNHRWFEYTGFTPEQTYAGKTALHPDDFPVYVKSWSNALKQKKIYESEYRFRRSDGTFRWHLVRGVPIRNSKGKVVKWLGTFTDIHDKKQAEDHVRKANQRLEQRVQERTRQLHDKNRELQEEIVRRKEIEARDGENISLLRHIINTLPTGAMITDARHRILQVNDQLSQLFGLGDSLNVLLDRPDSAIHDFIASNVSDPASFRERLEQAIRKHTPRRNEEIRLKDGRILLRDYFPIAIQGIERGSLFLYRDVTHERRVDTAKSEFMSLASHQLRTPLTSLRWALTRLSKMLGDGITPPQSRLLSVSRDSVRRMADTIHTMLQISLVESQTVRLVPLPVRLDKFLHDLQADHRQNLEAKQLSCTVHCTSAVRLYTDPQILREILSNLLSNAIKYTPEGGMITIRCTRHRGGIAVDVEDTGMGIPQYQQVKIFTKFFRADNVMQRDTEGTGLGLYLVFSLTRLLRGTITFTSTEGKGTTFQLVLPAA